MRLPDRLAAFFRQPGEVPLDEALLWLASVRPGGDVDVAHGLGLLDRWADAIDEPSIPALRALVYRELGFRGDVDDYHQAANSYLDEVLERRCGMPITLAVVLLSIGRRVGLDLAPVGAPGHFLVVDRPSATLLDPFAEAAEIDRTIIESRLAAGGLAIPIDDALAPVSDQAVLARVVNNLTNTMMERSNPGLDWVLDLRLALPLRHQDPRLLASLCERRGRFDRAADLLELLAEATQREDLTRRAHALRSRLN